MRLASEVGFWRAKKRRSASSLATRPVEGRTGFTGVGWMLPGTWLGCSVGLVLGAPGFSRGTWLAGGRVVGAVLPGVCGVVGLVLGLPGFWRGTWLAGGRVAGCCCAPPAISICPTITD